jgi:DNA repair photolyase
MIKEIVVDRALTYEYPPDGGTVPIVDPYDGCTLHCPYCFQLRDEEWNRHVYVKQNIADLLPQEFLDWNQEETVYIGSKCDPYMELERYYQLTRKCLVELAKLNLNVMVTTKSDSKLIFRDLDIIESMGSRFTLLLGLSNLKQLQQQDDVSLLGNIQTANQLYRMGVQVWVFITPILPGITDVDDMIDALDGDIPVFLDKVRINQNTKPANKMEAYIKRHHPHLINVYHDIIHQGSDVYYEGIRNKWSNDGRIKFVFE